METRFTKFFNVFWENIQIFVKKLVKRKPPAFDKNKKI